MNEWSSISLWLFGAALGWAVVLFLAFLARLFFELSFESDWQQLFDHATMRFFPKKIIKDRLDLFESCELVLDERHRPITFVRAGFFPQGIKYLCDDVSEIVEEVERFFVDPDGVDPDKLPILIQFFREMYFQGKRIRFIEELETEYGCCPNHILDRFDTFGKKLIEKTLLSLTSIPESLKAFIRQKREYTCSSDKASGYQRIKNLIAQWHSSLPCGSVISGRTIVIPGEGSFNDAGGAR